MEQLSEDEQRSSRPPRRLTVMSYNIRGGQAALHGPAYLDSIAQLIASSGADVVGLQEVHRETWRSRFRDQAEELRARTGFDLAFAPSMDLGRGACGNALLTRGTVLHTLTHRLPVKGEPRTMLEVLVEAGGGVFTAYVTHLAASGRRASVARLRQASHASRLVRKSRLPFVLASGFDSTPTSRELRMFSDRSKIVSCREAVAKVEKCLTYIFVDPQWSVMTAHVLDGGPSDHRPLIAELERRTSPGRVVDSGPTDERERPA
jgi:endonuclease/exonuclease/phosphatase family metal-dependent hydrolase